MSRIWRLLASVMAITVLGSFAEAIDPGEWTVYITNDNCPDYTWGLTEEQTRRAFAEIVRAHLYEMTRTDAEQSANQDRYNMAVTQEALCFIEHYPQRKDELIERIKQGRIFVSPYLCNTLWGFQGVEGAIRSFYPARRLERDWGIRIDVAEHIEEPSLPWGTAPILAGCGIRWVSIPYLNYDCTFTGLKNPPLFVFEGPDGSRIRVVMDAWASNKASYSQGAYLLNKPQTVIGEWLPHYAALGKTYPLNTTLASGTHSDISLQSGAQARRFSDAIKKYNSQNGNHPRLINGILPDFCRAVDEVENNSPFMPTLRGCFGQSWDLWPVCLAKYAADMRDGEREFLAAESLVAIAGASNNRVCEQTRDTRRRAEWCLAMLSDHAWNGTDDTNRRVNAQLRRSWSEELKQSSVELVQTGWTAIGLTQSKENMTVFNSLSFKRAAPARVEWSGDAPTIVLGDRRIESQVITEDGHSFLYFVVPEIDGFEVKGLKLKPETVTNEDAHKLSASEKMLESPYYRLTVDANTGGVSSMVHKASGQELVVQPGRRLCETVYFDGNEHTMKDVTAEVVAKGPVLARLRICGAVGDIRVTNFITVYAQLDRVNFDLRITKPVTNGQQRLCQVFPVMRQGAVLRIETTGAVVRPRPQPQGDLLAGADTRRFAVQGFADASLPGGIGVTIAPLDAFALRQDLEPITFESIGNDQNYKEVVKDQDGVTDFRFRYVLRGHANGYDNAETFAWSRSVSMPLLAALGKVEPSKANNASVEIDPKRAIATCFKPADEGASSGTIMRIWEVGGVTGPLELEAKGYRRAMLTDLLERDIHELQIVKGRMTVEVKPNGFAAVRLLP